MVMLCPRCVTDERVAVSVGSSVTYGLREGVDVVRVGFFLSSAERL